MKEHIKTDVLTDAGKASRLLADISGRLLVNEEREAARHADSAMNSLESLRAVLNPPPEPARQESVKKKSRRKPADA